MRILLAQVDGKMPNLALMKIANHHQQRGDTVELNYAVEPNLAYISCIFSRNRAKALGMASFMRSLGIQVQIGGSGINLQVTLPDEIEHLMPAYDLWDVDYSMGFTSRGCIRSCPFCIVPQKEGMIRDNAPISEFLHPDHDKLILFDNNFLASPKWRQNLREIIDRGLKVNFNQGLDIRLINGDNADMLARSDFYSWHFRTKQLHFAFDDPAIEPQVRSGVATLESEGIKPRYLMFFMLCGFDTDHGQDLHRFKVLRELGVDPFVMKYNNRRDDPWLNHFARWVNKRVYKACDLADYDEGDSQRYMAEGIRA
jgi:hypothetical protein